MIENDLDIDFLLNNIDKLPEVEKNNEGHVPLD